MKAWNQRDVNWLIGFAWRRVAERGVRGGESMLMSSSICRLNSVVWTSSRTLKHRDASATDRWTLVQYTFIHRVKRLRLTGHEMIFQKYAHECISWTTKAIGSREIQWRPNDVDWHGGDHCTMKTKKIETPEQERTVSWPGGPWVWTSPPTTRLANENVLK